MQIREIEIEISKNAQNKRKKFIKMYKITIYSCKFAHLVVGSIKLQVEERCNCRKKNVERRIKGK